MELKRIIKEELLKEAKIKVSNDEYEKLYETNELIAIKPKTHNAACKYGMATKWCVTMRSTDRYWNTYTEKTNIYGGYKWKKKDGDKEVDSKFIPRGILYFIIQKNVPPSDPYSKVALLYNPNTSEYEGNKVNPRNIIFFDALDNRKSLSDMYNNIENFNEAFHEVENDYLNEKETLYNRTGIWV
jgi:hypothetical protein